MSAEAILFVGPKWILMNLPWKRVNDEKVIDDDTNTDKAVVQMMMQLADDAKYF